LLDALLAIFSTPSDNISASSEPSFNFLPVSSAFPIFILFLNLRENQLTAAIVNPANNIAIIVCRGPHEAVHSKKPATSKKNVAIMFRDPVIETRVVIIIDTKNFTKSSLKNGKNPVMPKINMKKPIQTPSVTINSCQVAPSSTPNMNLRNGLMTGGTGASFVKMSSVCSSSPPASALSFSFV